MKADTIAAADAAARARRLEEAGSSRETSYHPILLSLRYLEKPIVTAVHGPAAGVGISGWLDNESGGRRVAQKSKEAAEVAKQGKLVVAGVSR